MVQVLTKDIEQLKQGIRDFIENEIEPHANLIEETDEHSPKYFRQIEGNGFICS